MGYFQAESNKTSRVAAGAIHFSSNLLDGSLAIAIASEGIYLAGWIAALAGKVMHRKRFLMKSLFFREK